MYAEWTAPNGETLKSETITQKDVYWSTLEFIFDENAVEASTSSSEESDLDGEYKVAANQIHAFRAAYESALNLRDYYEIEGFMVKGSEADLELRDYIGKLKNENYTYEFTNNIILDVKEVKDGIYEVTTEEHFIFTNHEGKQTEYEREKVYTLIKLDGVYQIETIEINDTNRNKL